jgi:hypothetical protein
VVQCGGQAEVVVGLGVARWGGVPGDAGLDGPAAEVAVYVPVGRQGVDEVEAVAAVGAVGAGPGAALVGRGPYAKVSQAFGPPMTAPRQVSTGERRVWDSNPR